MAEDIDILSDNISEGQDTADGGKSFIPVPLKYVSARQLANVPIYFKTDNEYCLYSGDGLGFSSDDRQRLLESKVKYVYISENDRDKLFDIMADSLAATINDSSIDFIDKTEMIHGASLSLAMQLNQTPPDRKKVEQTINNSSCNVQMFANGMSLKDMYKLCTNDPADSSHLVKMASIMQGFATKLGLTDKYSLSMMGTGAMLHDIGKIFLPKTNRTPEMVRSHVELGIKHLDSLPNIPAEVVSIVAEHHERIDGSGYPYGLRGNDISLMGQIAGLAYTFENLVHENSYKNERESITNALDQLETKFASKFDTTMLSSFLAYASSALLDKAENKSKLSMFSLSSLDAEHRKANPHGRRHQRFFFRCKGTGDLLFLKNEKWTVKASYDVVLHNVSQSGMGFMVYTKLKKDDIILIKLFVNSQTEPICLLGKVKRVQEVTSDLFIIGCSYFETNSLESTKRLFERLSLRSSE